MRPRASRHADPDEVREALGKAGAALLERPLSRGGEDVLAGVDVEGAVLAERGRLQLSLELSFVGWNVSSVPIHRQFSHVGPV